MSAGVMFAALMTIPLTQIYLVGRVWKRRYPRLERIALEPVSPRPVEFEWSPSGIVLEAWSVLLLCSLPILRSMDPTDLRGSAWTWMLVLVGLLSCARATSLLIAASRRAAFVVSPSGLEYRGTRIRWQEVSSVRGPAGLYPLVVVSVATRRTSIVVPASNLAEPYAFAAYANKMLLASRSGAAP